MTRPNVLDVNSSEIGIDAVLGNCLEFFKARPEAGLILAGHQKKIQASENYPPLEDKVIIDHAPDTFGMHEHPARVLRNPNNSLARAYHLVASGQAEAMISGGNSGGVGYAALQKKVHDLVERVAAYSNLPNKHLQDVSICDIGTATDVSPQTLLVYGILLNEEIKSRGLETKIGLLNLGEEDCKGNKHLKETFKIYKEAGFPWFVGNVEGDDIFIGKKANGIITNADIGNPVLKAAEGLHKLEAFYLKEISGELVEKYAKTPEQQQEYGQIAQFMVKEYVKRVGLQKRIGAIILGTEDKIVLSHGNAPVYGALLMADDYAKRTVDYDQIRNSLENHRKLIENSQ